MAEIFDIDDLHILDRFAKKEGYANFRDYLPTLQTWDISIPIAAECVRKGISFSEYKNNPSLLEDALPEGVIDIFDLYRAREERMAEQKTTTLEEKITATKATPLPKREHLFHKVFYGIASGLVAASALIGLSTFQANPAHLESELLNDPLCTSIEGLYVCLDDAEHGPFFGSYWEYKTLREGNK